jgi:CubicO group peptidase (beta-lactamase class C family)
MFLVVLTAEAGIPQAKLTEGQIQWIDRIFSSFNNNTPGAAIAVMRNGDIIYKRGFGIANLEYNIPIQPDSIFNIASISKEFTAMAVVLLELEGKLSLDDDIRKYIPEVPNFGETITINHLAHHTSGLRDQWELLLLAGACEKDFIVQEDVLDIVSRQKELNFKPGEEYLYSNTGYTLLAIIVERVSGQSLQEYADEYIFKPLEMFDTHFHDDTGEIVKNRAYGYEPGKEGCFIISISNIEVYGPTSLFTTVLDMLKWSQNFFHKKVGGEEGIRRLLTKGILNSGKEIDYGLGIMHGSYRGLSTVGHGGSELGYKANLLIFPEQKVSISICANINNVEPSKLSKQIANVILNDEFLEKQEPESFDYKQEIEILELTKEQLEEFVGTFYSEELEVDYTIKSNEVKLYLERRKYPPQKILPVERDVFIWDKRKIVFSRNNSQKIDGLKINSERVRNLKFMKREK